MGGHSIVRWAFSHSKDLWTPHPPKNKQTFSFRCIIIQKMILNIFSCVTFFNMRLTFWKKPSLNLIQARFFVGSALSRYIVISHNFNGFSGFILLRILLKFGLFCVFKYWERFGDLICLFLTFLSGWGAPTRWTPQFSEGPCLPDPSARVGIYQSSNIYRVMSVARWQHGRFIAKKLNFDPKIVQNPYHDRECFKT